MLTLTALRQKPALQIPATLLLAVWPLLPAPPVAYFTSSLADAWPRLLILLAINFALVNQKALQADQTK